MAARFDEVRIVKGRAMWNAAFTPPASPYTISGGDTAALSGTISTPGSAGFNAVEAADTAALTGAVTGYIGSLTATEAADAAVITGTVTAAGIAGSLAATEASDTASITGSVSAPATITGSLGAVEAPDIVYFDARDRVTSGGDGGGGGGRFIDYGRVRRQKARGLRQAEKFFEKLKEEAEEKKRKLEVVAKQAEQTDEPSRQTVDLFQIEQQQRQQQVIDAMLAQAAARVAQARVELAQLEALQRAMDLDEEDAITVLLLQ